MMPDTTLLDILDVLRVQDDRTYWMAHFPGDEHWSPLRSSDTMRFLVCSGWLVRRRNLPGSRHHFRFVLVADPVSCSPGLPLPWHVERTRDGGQGMPTLRLDQCDVVQAVLPVDGRLRFNLDRRSAGVYKVHVETSRLR